MTRHPPPLPPFANAAAPGGVRFGPPGRKSGLGWAIASAAVTLVAGGVLIWAVVEYRDEMAYSRTPAGQNSGMPAGMGGFFLGVVSLVPALVGLVLSVIGLLLPNHDRKWPLLALALSIVFGLCVAIAWMSI